jgi:protease IV
MVAALILLALLGLSMLYNISSFASNLLRGGGHHYAARTSGPRLDELVREDNGVSSKIAVIPITGIIMGGAFEQGGVGMVSVVKAQFKAAEEDDRVKAVLLRVDSPGGEVLASDEINHIIAEFQKNNPRKPVVACMGTVAASGGYYVSAPCRWIVANELTITGSIGVIMSSYNYRGLMDKVGVQPVVFKSGKFKDMLSGSREPESITQEEKDMIQGLINETYGKFKSVVQDGRAKAHDINKSNRDPKDQGRELASDWTELADGRVLSGTEALKHGFVDELGGFEDAVARTKKIAGISEANLIEYQQRFDFADFFKMFGKSETKSLKIDLGMQMPRLQAGHLYFLSPTFVQ